MNGVVGGLAATLLAPTPLGYVKKVHHAYGAFEAGSP